MAVQFNFRVGNLGHIYIMAGSKATARALAQTVQEDTAFQSLPTYLLAKQFAMQLYAADLIPNMDIDYSFRLNHVAEVGFTDAKFVELFGSLPVESIAAFDMPINPEFRA
jgi:hypothetical protein